MRVMNERATIKPLTAETRNRFGRAHLFTVFACLSCLFWTGCGQKFAALSAKGQTAYEERKFAEAVDAFHLALVRWKQEDGTDQKARVYFLMGKSYDKLRKIDKTIEAYLAAIDLDPTTPEPAYELGLIYLTSNEYENALRSFQSALRIKKDDPLSLLGLGNSYYGLKKFPDAKAAYEKVLDVSPGVRTAMEALSVVKQKSASSKKSRKTVTTNHAPAQKRLNYQIKKTPRR